MRVELSTELLGSVPVGLSGSPSTAEANPEALLLVPPLTVELSAVARLSDPPATVAFNSPAVLPSPAWKCHRIPLQRYWVQRLQKSWPRCLIAKGIKP